MFDPRSDRINYTEMLRPPEGYELELAVGVTYSLELDALINARLALGMPAAGAEMTADNANSFKLRKAFDDTEGKVLLFCHKIHSRVSEKNLPVCLQAADSVFQIHPNKITDKTFRSFHPKLWIVKYGNTSGGQDLFRLAVMSRNLTFDNSWDVCFCTDDNGENSFPQVNSKDLVPLLKYLCKHADDTAKEKLQGLIKDLKKLYNTDPKAGEDAPQLMISGVRGGSKFDRSSLWTDVFDELFIMSPFLSKNTIKSFNRRCKKGVLVTREEQLKKLQKADVRNFNNIYTLKEELRKNDIHAKIYLTCKDGKNCLYVGSLNATSSAFKDNVEAVFKLTMEEITVDRLMKALKDYLEEKDKKLIKYEEPETKDEPDLDWLFEQISMCAVIAEAAKSADNRWSLAVYFDKKLLDLLGDLSVTLRPISLTESKSKEISKSGDADEHGVFEGCVFDGLELSELTELYELELTDKGKKGIIMILTEGIPEERNRILKEILKQDDDYFRWLVAGILGPAAGGIGQERTVDGSGEGKWNINQKGLFDMLLTSSAYDPGFKDKLERIKKYAEEIQNKPEGVEELLNIFCKEAGLDG